MTAPEAPAIRQKRCEACGTSFECRAGGCWCDKVALAPGTRARLRRRYADCLCPACLRAHGSPGPAGQSGRDAV